MAESLPRLIASTSDQVDYQETCLRVDAIARNVCNTWEQAMTNPAFGRSSNRQRNVRRVLCGQTFSEYKVEAHTPARSRRVPRRSARSRFAQHRIESAMAMDPANDNGLPTELVWGLPGRGDTSFVRTRYCVGGKS